VIFGCFLVEFSIRSPSTFYSRTSCKNLPKSFCQSVNVTREKLRKARSYEKCACKMLMKLTLGWTAFDKRSKNIQFLLIKTEYQNYYMRNNVHLSYIFYLLLSCEKELLLSFKNKTIALKTLKIRALLFVLWKFNHLILGNL